jgi:hypothetical protein
MRAFTIYYNERSDDTKIKYSDAFDYADWIMKADILKDTINMLEDLYDDILIKAKENYEQENARRSAEVCQRGANKAGLFSVPKPTQERDLP